MEPNGRLAENEQFGKYRIVRLMGEGGMGAVYEAVHPVLKKRFAIKTLLPTVAAQRDARTRFLREAEAASRINHPNVVAVLDVGTEGDTPYLVMEFLDGETLDALIERRSVLPVADAVDLMLPVISAVSTAHEHGVIHRDLKPQNILFRENGRLAIADFGLARDLGADSSLTAHGSLFATPRYMSPEQFMGQTVDPRSDLYSLGVILVEMLTGKRVFEAENAAGLIYQHVHGPIPQLPGKLAGYQPIVDRLLAKKPEDRFQSARDLFSYIAI